MSYSRRDFLQQAFAFSAASWGWSSQGQPPERGLRDIFPHFGAAVQVRRLQSDQDFSTAVVQECGILTPEVELKWGRLRPSLDQFNFEPADALLAFSQANRQKMRGHTLAWYRDARACPWLVEALAQGNPEQILRDHIRQTVGRYRGKIISWDVVNECVDEKEPDGLRRCVWHNALGERYIDLAFHTAHEADPAALLVLNETNLEYENARYWARRQAFLNIIDRLQARGVPLHAVGLESHLSLNAMSPNIKWRKDFSPEAHTAFVRELHKRGLKVLITELDIRDQTSTISGIVERDTAAAQHVGDYVRSVRAAGALWSMQCWGISDRYSWINHESFREDGSRLRPLPLNRDLQRKPMWFALAQALQR